MKNFILIVLIFALSSCGYTSIYKGVDKKNNPKILIQEIQGDNTINNILKRKLKRYETNNSEEIFNLKAKTSFSKTVLSKDKTGRAIDLKLSIKIDFIVTYENKKSPFSFEESLILDQLVFNLKILK